MPIIHLKNNYTLEKKGDQVIIITHLLLRITPLTKIKELKRTGYFKAYKIGRPLLLKVDNIPYLVAVSICHCS